MSESATERLRRMLDERGVEWEDGDAAYEIEWSTPDGRHCSAMYWKPTFSVLISGCTPEQAIAATLGGEINGDTSDGYHTFNELYHHRAVLFSVIVANHRGIAWKSKLHHDGTMYDDMFIVGIDTPWGQASYHYDIDPYWDMFDCEERESAPEWDGHTPDEAIERIGKLATLGGGKLTAEQVGEAIERNFGKLCVLDDGKPVEWREDWVCRVGIDYKAIADELNAALGGGECEWELEHSGTLYDKWRCSECKFLFVEPRCDQGYMDLVPNYCPNCGRKVKR